MPSLLKTCIVDELQARIERMRPLSRASCTGRLRLRRVQRIVTFRYAFTHFGDCSAAMGLAGVAARSMPAAA